MKYTRARDLMVVSKATNMTPACLQAETACLHTLLDSVEAPANVAIACEIINLNRYKIEKRRDKVLQALHKGTGNPFIFLFIRN